MNTGHPIISFHSQYLQIPIFMKQTSPGALRKAALNDSSMAGCGQIELKLDAGITANTRNQYV